MPTHFIADFSLPIDDWFVSVTVLSVPTFDLAYVRHDHSNRQSAIKNRQ